MHLGRLLLAAGYLLAVCAATLLLLDAQSAKLWKASRALFSSYSLLAQLDLQFRGGLQVYVERFLLSNTLLFTEVWGDLLTPEQHAYRLNISRYTYDCACTVLNTKNIVGFLLNEFKNKQITIAYALNNFTANPHLADLPGDILGALLNTRLQVRSYRGWTDEEVSSVGVSASLFVGNFKVCLQAFEAALLAFRPFMVNKGPPFGIPPALVRAKFRDEVPSRFAVMRNSVNGLLEFYADTLRNIKVEAVSTQPQAYADAQLLIGLGFLCFYLLFLALGLRLAATFHQSLGRLLRLYELLRPEELEFHRAVLLARAAVLQRSRLDELHMAQAYTQLLRLDGDAPGQTGRAKKLKVAAARGGQAVRDHVFFTSKLAAALTVASLAVVGYVGGVLVHETRSFGLLRRRVAFYTDTYERFARAFDYYLSHSFLSIYGDFVRIGGALPSQLMEEARAEREINELTTYLLSQRSQLHALFDAADATIIDEMLFVDVCAHLNRAKLTYANDVRICRDSGFAGQGFITFMNFERDTLRIIRDMVLADRGFLRGSQTDFLLFPFQTYLFRTASLNFRITHKLVFETLLETVLPAGEKTVFAGLARLEAVLATLKLQTSLLLVAGYLLLLVLAVIVAMRRDLRACKQTLLNIHPNVTLANKSLYRQFDSIFTFQL